MFYCTCMEMDKITPEKRSWVMAQVKAQNTRPEKIVRSLLHRLGYRFRLHRKELPGRPDIVLPKYRTAIFVNGCFWHAHPGCKRVRIPEEHREYWLQKLDKNRIRDAKNIMMLKNAGWHVLIIWECELKNVELTQKRLIDFFGLLQDRKEN